MSSTALPAPNGSVSPLRRVRRRIQAVRVSPEWRDLRLLRRCFAAYCVAAAGWLIFFAAAPLRTVCTPALLDVAIVLFVILRLFARERAMPVFDLGTVFVSVLLLYATVPIMNYVAGGMEWVPAISDNRLAALPNDPRHVADIAWSYTAYLAGFAVTYLLVRGRPAPLAKLVSPPRRALQASLVVVCVVSSVAYASLYVAASVAALPYIGVQLLHILQSIRFTAKQAVILVLMARWRSPAARAILVGWLAAEVGTSAWRLGSRGEAALLVLTAGFMYHRLVRPLRVRTAMIFGALLVGGFLAAGLRRDFFARSDTPLPPGGALAASNEFQALFANAYDLDTRRREGTLSVPLQIYLSELYMPIPSQMLPFAKIDPADWYLDVMGFAGTGQGYMFGVVAQGVIGGGRLELLLRGCALAVLFALIHRWYVRRQTAFWPTFFYLFLCTWTYYTFRSTTFFIIYMIIYYFLPVLVFSSVLRVAVSRIRNVSRKVIA